MNEWPWTRTKMMMTTMIQGQRTWFRIVAELVYAFGLVFSISFFLSSFSLLFLTSSNSWRAKNRIWYFDTKKKKQNLIEHNIENWCCSSIHFFHYRLLFWDFKFDLWPLAIHFFFLHNLSNIHGINVFDPDEQKINDNLCIKQVDWIKCFLFVCLFVFYRNEMKFVFFSLYLPFSFIISNGLLKQKKNCCKHSFINNNVINFTLKWWH